MKLLRPVKPFNIVQKFGNDPAYYAKFHDVYGQPEKGHMGLDLQASHGEPVYASHDGVAFFERDAHGGEGVYINGDRFRTIYWHLIGGTDSKFPSPVPLDGSPKAVKAGDLIGYADNTGAPFESSGDHLHFGLIMINAWNQPQNQNNGFNGCIDPEPFITEEYAVDVQLKSKMTKLVELLKLLYAKLLQNRG